MSAPNAARRSAVCVAAAALAMLGCRAEPVRAPAQAPLTERAIADSMDAATRRGRSDLALLWAGRRRALDPGSPARMIGQAAALHDFVWARPREERLPEALRTSLDRIEIDLKAMALCDSAARTAGTEPERATAGRLIGLLYENYGLHVDALRQYRSTAGATGGDPMLDARIRHVEARLRAPLTTPRGTLSDSP